MHAPIRFVAVALLVLTAMAAASGHLAAQPLPGGDQGLNQSGWKGKETLPGYGPLYFAFSGPNQVVMYDADNRPVGGTFSMNGKTVTMSFYNNTVVYTGELNGPIRPGTTMRGSATNGQQNWTFEVTMHDGPPNPPTGGARR
jgi:hypothetical protein